MSDNSKFYLEKNMDRGPNSTPRRRVRTSSRYDNSSAHRRHDPHADGGLNSPSEISFCGKEDVSPYGIRTSQPRSVGSKLEQANHINPAKYQNWQVRSSPGAKHMSTAVEKLSTVDGAAKAVTPFSDQHVRLSASVSSSEKYYSSETRGKNFKVWRPRKGQMVKNSPKSGDSLHFEPSAIVDDTSSSLASSHFKDIPSKDGSHQCLRTSQKRKEENEQPANSAHESNGGAFDICSPRSGTIVTLKAPLHVQNRIKRDEAKRSTGGQHIIELRPGMILLKKYISFHDQMKVVKACRDLGLGPGGFYEPGYRDGGKLHLKMMCLGKNWDPEKRKYEDERPFDCAKPPPIPSKFHQLVDEAIEASHSFLRERCKMFNVEHVLPSMSPNICIVNFYTKSGRLGLHQDNDESENSIDRGLPVVSLSIGDSAEFLYGDQRAAEKADKVVLESGDVLIFGGKSRRVFHGVKSIVADTAPKALLEETSMLPGRLNLTFREY